MVNEQVESAKKTSDIDLDNDFDLLVGSESIGVSFFRNIGTIDSVDYIIDSIVHVLRVFTLNTAASVYHDVVTFINI